ncbi:flagellar basal body rod protein FlgC [Candidatus Caldatribacterium saccharofermentans]|uniref:flagellar basal body rod protein FlgC n=1 Tax=Candidatus Caldatribacterium saccharofermentans TaxID=1454753 RepID=UPI003D089E47
MKIFRSFDISASALTAERLRLSVIATNIANAETTRTPQGGPYRRKEVVFTPRADGGVEVAAIQEDTRTPLRLLYDPGHPDANEDGFVAYPNVLVVNEMVDLLAATRAYEANVAALNAAKSMLTSTLNIGK